MDAETVELKLSSCLSCCLPFLSIPKSPLSVSAPVKWNFIGHGKKQLSLEIGDTVYVQESCDGEGGLQTRGWVLKYWSLEAGTG